VRAVVAHYRGRIDDWEVWNEPYFEEFWRAPPEAYRPLLDGALAAGRVASPGANLLASGCGERSCRRWEQRAWAARETFAGFSSSSLAEAPQPGAVALHVYDKRLLMDDEDVAARVAAARARFGSSVRLWNTEGSAMGAVGSPLPSPVDAHPDPERDGAAFVRWAVESLAAGCERVFVYPLVESESASDSDLALLEADGTPRPAASALAVLVAAIGERRFARTVRRAQRVAHVFSDGRSELAVVIADGLRPFDLAAHGARDVFGNPLAPGETARVVYLQSDSPFEWERLLESGRTD
jgi:hypothetical protein